MGCFSVVGPAFYKLNALPGKWRLLDWALHFLILSGSDVPIPNIVNALYPILSIS